MRRLVLAGLLLSGGWGMAAQFDPDLEALRAEVTADDAERLLSLARETVARTASGLGLPPVDPAVRHLSCGVFVTLVDARGVRGCYGDLNASMSSLEEAVVQASRGAAALDRRFLPVRPGEVLGLTVIVSLTMPPEPVTDWRTIDPDRFGMLLTAGDRSAVLLPGEARTAAWGVAECLRKAGIGPDEPVQVYRFRTETLIERGAP